ncbi:MAG: M56 family metallopeptidase [Gemmatimonadaceae bacterium]
MISWMLYAIVLSLLITGVAGTCAQLCTLYKIPTRWCWIAALVCSVAAPLVARSVPQRVQSGALRLTAVTYNMIDAVSALSAPATTAPGSTMPATPDTAIATVWAITSVAFLLVMAVARARLRAARRTWRSQTVCGERVLISTDTGPAVVGIRRQWIVLPEWALDLNSDELSLAVTHEREHVIARDPWLLLAALAAVAFAPWNPVLWLQLRQLRRAVEGDCDARVLARTGNARCYATLLITVGERSRTTRAPVLALSYPTSILEWRIRTMTNRTPSHRPARAVACATLAGALVAAVVLLPRPGMSQSSPLKATPHAQIYADTGTNSAIDSTISASLAATRDTLARLRKQMHREPFVVRHVTIRNGRASVAVFPDTSVSSVLQTNVSVATVQAAIASRFPGAATATPGPKRAFAFMIDSAGHIQQSYADTSTGAAARHFAVAGTNADIVSASAIAVFPHIPVGSDSVSVIWMVRK